MLGGDARHGACAVDVHRAVLTVGRNDHGFQLVAVLQEGVAGERFSQRECQIGELDALAAHEREGDRVGAARTHALDVVATVLVADGAVLRARGGVHGDHGSAYQRLPVLVGDRTVQSRSRHLGRGGRNDEDREHQKEKFLHTLLIFE